MAFWTKANLAT